MKNKQKILYVDDERMNLFSFKEVFKRKYKVFTAISGEEGLKILDEEPDIPVIITDQRMPNMTGVEFLTKTIEKYPDAIRMILTGYSDIDAIIDAVNKGQIYKYIAKPWEMRDLERTIEEVLGVYNLRIDNKQLVSELKTKNEELQKSYHDLEETYKQLKEAQERLVQSEKMATIGQLSSGIAHEIKNQLVVMSLTEAIRDKYPSDEDLNLYSTEISEASNRILSIVEEIRDFAKGRGANFVKQEYFLKDTVERAIKIVKLDKELKYMNITMDIKQNPQLKFNKNKILQVFVNLTRNAAQAYEKREGNVNIVLDADDEYAIVKVIDFGCGISEENLQKIFTTFFTTKGEIGTGLGLEISRKIIESHGGTIEVDSKLNEGTTFTIKLPIEQA